MIVGLNSDKSVTKLKGEHRPIIDEDTRALILASFSYVHAVVIFEEETPIDLITLIQPDVLVKGGDYKEVEVVGHDVVKQNGGELVIVPLLDGYSSSTIEAKIKHPV